MKIHRLLVLSAGFLALALGFCGQAAAQSEIVKVDWEISRLQGKDRAPYVPVAALKASPDTKFSDNLRALITLKNPTAKPVEGLVLRYSVRLQLLKKGDAPEKAFWGVPFHVEEVRVSKITPGAEKTAKILRFELQEQLKKLRGSGFLPVAIKLEVMLCPRLGDEAAGLVRESALNILP
jgi:hypothetical protein